MKIRKTFWVLLVLLVIVFIAGRQLQYDLLNRILYAIITLIIFAWLWAKTSLNGITFNRWTRSNRKETGEVFEERFRIENVSPYLKSWIEIIDQSQLPGNNGSRIMAWVGKRELRNYSSYTVLNKRGNYNLSPTIIKSGDPFGLFEITRNVTSQDSLLVLPHHYKIHRFPLPTGYLPGGKSIRRKTTAITPYAAGIREYLPGDSLNRIHWKKTAQRGILISKEFEEDPQSDVWIILDSQIEAHTHSEIITETILDGPLWGIKQKTAYQLPKDTYEYAICIAATLADFFIRKGQGVGFYNSGKTSYVIPPEKGHRQYQKIVETLAFVKADGEQALEAGVTGHIQHILPGSLVILISTNKSSGLVTSAEYFKLRKIAPFMIVLNNKTFSESEPENVKILAELNRMGIANKTIGYRDVISEKLQA